MGKPVALVTGACGEMGHLLLPALRARGFDTVAVDLAELPQELRADCLEVSRASILDADAMRRLVERHHPEEVFHLAAVLSTKAEREPDLAFDVNLGGTVSLLRLCRDDARERGRDVRFLFPSSIAVYGLPDRAAKDAAGALRETDWDRPSGLYGINKLQCEMLGTYFTARARRAGEPGLDFRAIRFPGLISAATLPSGGTSDYGPEMMHAAAQGKPYACFVAAETRLPFMTMSDAVESFLRLAGAPSDSLRTRVYNVKSFSVSAAEIRVAVLVHYPAAKVTFEPQAARQAIVDTWPADVDDSRARSEWGFAPRRGLAEALRDEFVPALQRRYAARATT
jgi:threonine 3-dehydrogenase